MRVAQIIYYWHELGWKRAVLMVQFSLVCPRRRLLKTDHDMENTRSPLKLCRQKSEARSDPSKNRIELGQCTHPPWPDKGFPSLASLQESAERRVFVEGSQSHDALGSPIREEV